MKNRRCISLSFPYILQRKTISAIYARLQRYYSNLAHPTIEDIRITRNPQHRKNDKLTPVECTLTEVVNSQHAFLYPFPKTTRQDEGRNLMYPPLHVFGDLSWWRLQQGYVGDCVYVSTLIGLFRAEVNVRKEFLASPPILPKSTGPLPLIPYCSFIRSCILPQCPSPSGHYCIRVSFNGAERCVDIDDRFYSWDPHTVYSPFTNYLTSLSVHATPELWVSLLEKGLLSMLGASFAAHTLYHSLCISTYGLLYRCVYPSQSIHSPEYLQSFKDGFAHAVSLFREEAGFVFV